jgi:hypothetical protein
MAALSINARQEVSLVISTAARVNVLSAAPKMTDRALSRCPTPKARGTAGQFSGPFQRSKPWHLERGTAEDWLAWHGIRGCHSGSARARP